MPCVLKFKSAVIISGNAAQAGTVELGDRAYCLNLVPSSGPRPLHC